MLLVQHGDYFVTGCEASYVFPSREDYAGAVGAGDDVGLDFPWISSFGDEDVAGLFFGPFFSTLIISAVGWND